MYFTDEIANTSANHKSSLSLEHIQRALDCVITDIDRARTIKVYESNTVRKGRAMYLPINDQLGIECAHAFVSSDDIDQFIESLLINGFIVDRVKKYMFSNKEK